MGPGFPEPTATYFALTYFNASCTRSTITCATESTLMFSLLEPSRSRTSIVPLFTVSRPATAMIGTPMSSASLN